MIDVVIGYDKEDQVYKVYEPSTDTLLVTTSLGESFIKLSEFLKSSGMIMGDLLGDLLKRLNQAPSGFMISGQRFGQSTTSSSQNKSGGNGKKQKFGGSGGTFSKSKFNESYKKFGDRKR